MLVLIIYPMSLERQSAKKDLEKKNIYFISTLAIENENKEKYFSNKPKDRLNKIKIHF